MPELAVEYGLKALSAALGLLDAILGRSKMEKLLDAARATYAAEGRPPTDEELRANLETAEDINERIQNA